MYAALPVLQTGNSPAKIMFLDVAYFDETFCVLLQLIRHQVTFSSIDIYAELAPFALQ